MSSRSGEAYCMLLYSIYLCLNSCWNWVIYNQGPQTGSLSGNHLLTASGNVRVSMFSKLPTIFVLFTVGGRYSHITSLLRHDIASHRFSYDYMISLPLLLWYCWLSDRKGVRPVKNWVVGCWHGYLSGARWRFAHGPADATATHHLLLQ